MSDKVRVGIVGCGVIGQKHAQAAAACPRVGLVAVADINQDAARKVADQYHVPRVYKSAAKLIADGEVDAVVLALIAGLRTKLAVKAFAAGKHVLIEKPAAMNAGQVRRMIAARGDRVGACCSSRHRFLDSAKAATRLVGEGRLGHLRVVRARAINAAGERPTNSPPVWRLKTQLNAGGIMSNWGCYDLDYLLGVTGWTLRPRHVLAHTWTIPPVFAGRVPADSDGETHVAALIQCDGGTVITLDRAEYVAAPADYAWQIIGDEGALQMPLLPQKQAQLTHTAADADRGSVSTVVWEGAESWDTVHAGPIADFADAILDGRPPMTSLEHALVVQTLTDAIYTSSRTGRPVKIKDTPAA